MNNKEDLVYDIIKNSQKECKRISKTEILNWSQIFKEIDGRLSDNTTLPPFKICSPFYIDSIFSII